MVAKSNPPPGGGGHEVVTESAMKQARKPKEPGASSDAEQHKKKRKRIEEAATNSAQVIEDPGAASGSESHMKRRKKKKRHDEPTSTGLVSNSQSGEGFDADTGADLSLKKMEKKKKSITTSMENVAQVARDSGFGSYGESHEKKKKKRKKQKELIVVPAVVNDSQIVDDEELVVDAEPQLRKKKVKESISTASTMSSFQVVEELEPASGAEALVKKKKKKKKKKATEFTPTPGTVNSMQIVEDQELVNGAEAQSKKKTRKEVTLKPSTSNPETIAEDQDLVSDVELQSKKKKKKKKPTTLLPELDPSQIVDDSRPITGSATKTILRKQPVEAGHVSEPHRKKKVTFQLPDPTHSASTENEPTIEETGSTEFYNWSNDRTRTDLVWGGYTPEEDGALKQAIFDYIKEQGWTREEGIKKILNSRRSEATGCWFVIRKCLPQRELKRIYTRARKILGPGTHLGKWTSEEVQALMELQSVHGNNWKKISAMIGRDSYACRDKWRITKWSHTKTGLKAGAWSTEEQQKLCALVLKSLHVKSQMTKNGQIKKDHRVIRDDINWEFIAEKMEGRDRLACMTQWYRKMASPMVTTGEWANGDDQLLLERLMEEFPLSEELVEWDLLLNHRSGDVCKRRWEQMLRSLGRSSAVQHQHFLEKLENVTKMFAPHLLDKEYDQQFAEEMQKADVDKPDGEGNDEEEDDN